MLSLRDITYRFFYTLFKRKWLFTLSFFVIAGGVVLYGVLTTPLYKVNTMILVLQNPKQQMIFFPGITTPAKPSERVFPALNLKEIVTSRGLCESVVKRCGLDLRRKQKREHPEIFRDYVKAFIADAQDLPFVILDRLKILPMGPKDWVLKATEDLMYNSIEVGLLSETEVLNINVYDEDPKMALAVSNTIIEELEKRTVGLETEKSSQAHSFAKNQVSRQGEILKEAEEKYLDFKRRQDIVDLEKERLLLLNRLDDLKARAMDANRQIALNKAKLEEAEALVKSEEPDHMVKSSLNNRTPEKTRAGPVVEGPKLKPGWSQSYIELRKQIAEYQVSISGQRDLLHSLNVQIREVEGKVASIPGKEILLHRLEIERNNQEKLYHGLYDKMNELEVQKLSEPTEFDMKVINSPSLPDVPDTYWPQWDFVSIIALASGIFGGVLAVFIVDQFAGKVDDRAQLERMAQVKVLGSIPDKS